MKDEPEGRGDTVPVPVGPGVIAYLDMLGFSAAVLSRFDEASLDGLMDLRRAAANAPFSLVPSSGMGIPSSASTPQIQFFSDSIALSCMAKRWEPPQMWWCSVAILSRVPALIQACAWHGWGVRGCVESGPFLRSATELIGPPFVTACHLEKQKWTQARVLVGPHLLAALEGLARQPPPGLPPGSAEMALIRCDDGLIAVRPVLYGSDGELADRLSLRLARLRGEAPEKDRAKYDWIVEAALHADTFETPSADDLASGRKSLLELL